MAGGRCRGVCKRKGDELSPAFAGPGGRVLPLRLPAPKPGAGPEQVLPGAGRGFGKPGVSWPVNEGWPSSACVHRGESCLCLSRSRTDQQTNKRGGFQGPASVERCCVTGPPANPPSLLARSEPEAVREEAGLTVLHPQASVTGPVSGRAFS